jgi:hypothetical protein
LVSSGTNLNYGISRGADAPSSAVWGAVSVAVGIVFALSWTALIKAVERRRWVLVPMSAAMPWCSPAWGTVENVHLVEQWRDGKRLVSLEWMSERTAE